MIAKRIYNTIFFSKYYDYKNYTILCPKTWHRFNVRNCKELKQNELKNLYNERNRLYYKRKGLDGGTEKDAVTEEIIKVTDKIKNVKRELFYCDDIVERTNKILDEIKFIEEEKWNKQNEKDKVKDKKKVR